MRAAFQRARPGDQGERQLVAETHLADGDDGVWFFAHRASSPATMKPAADVVNRPAYIGWPAQPLPQFRDFLYAA